MKRGDRSRRAKGRGKGIGVKTKKRFINETRS
jgi:hypothetical protein